MSFLDVLSQQNVIAKDDIPYITEEAKTSGQKLCLMMFIQNKWKVNSMIL